ncbi:MAG: hypothetical protein INH37_14430, partial [Myxococcaceae bacterium]|nr:hypothetical protein [Myxococcaceae bacterium]
MRELLEPATSRSATPPALAAQRRAARVDLAVEIAVTAAGVAGVVLLGLVI